MRHVERNLTTWITDAFSHDEPQEVVERPKLKRARWSANNAQEVEWSVLIGAKGKDDRLFDRSARRARRQRGARKVPLCGAPAEGKHAGSRRSTAITLQ